MQDKRSINLCSTYILPLVGLNQTSFGVGNFVNSYVSEDNLHLVVELKQMVNVATQNPYFKFEFKKEDKLYAVFLIAKQFQSTVRLFRDGKYSQFPEDVKVIIRRKSGLRYKVPQSDGSVTSARQLLALDRDKELRKAMERELAVKLPVDAELASIPGDENFFALNLSNQLVS